MDRWIVVRGGIGEEEEEDHKEFSVLSFLFVVSVRLR